MDQLCRDLYNVIVLGKIKDPKNGAFGLDEVAK